MSSTCLVTGAQGFLGRHITAEFASAGYRVAGIGREAPPAEGLEACGLACYVAAELPGDELGDLLAAEQPDVIVHAAGPASVAASMTDPRTDFYGSVGLLYSLLDAVRLLSPASRVVILSSAAVYGNPEMLPVAESARLAPVSPYGFHKIQSETVLREFHDVYGLRSCAARIFSAYGVGLRRQILWDVCRKATADPAVRLFGTGDETRDFIHAADVGLAVRVLAEKAPMRGEPFNVASGDETSIRSVAELVVGELAPGTPIEFSGVERPGDPLRWRADVAAIRALGFSPRVGFDEGVADYCRWYRDVDGEPL